MSGPPGPRRVLLVGMMGAGKTTVGELLASELGWRYLDSDAEIQRRCAKTVPDIWRTEGEDAFRAQEAAVLADAVRSADPVVVAVAGGAVLDPANQARIAGAGLVVWLRADPSTLAGRVGAGEGRPLLDGDPAGAIARLYPQRAALYRSLADLVVDTDGRDPASVVATIENALAGGADAGGR